MNMSLDLVLLSKPSGTVEWDADHDFDAALATFRGDEKLLALMSEIGNEEDELFLTFTEDQLRKLIFVSEKIDDGTFDQDKDYARRYSNETMLDFYKRWDHIIKSLKAVLFRLDWETEHAVVYISC
jgi:hypothetical protein